MIYYPIQTLVDAGIRDILIVTGGRNAGDFLRLLAQRQGVRAHASRLHLPGRRGRHRRRAGAGRALRRRREDLRGSGRQHHRGQHPRARSNDFRKQAQRRADPAQGSARCRALRRGRNRRRHASSASKRSPSSPNPTTPSPASTCTTPRCSTRSATLVPSGRGELEITDVNNAYIREGTMTSRILDGWWTDAGTFESLRPASNLVREDGANRMDVARRAAPGDSWRTRRRGPAARPRRSDAPRPRVVARTCSASTSRTLPPSTAARRASLRRRAAATPSSTRGLHRRRRLRARADWPRRVNVGGTRSSPRRRAREDARSWYVSTDFVFDGARPSRTRSRPAGARCPRTGASKLAGEDAVRGPAPRGPDRAHAVACTARRQELPARDRSPRARGQGRSRSSRPARSPTMTRAPRRRRLRDPRAASARRGVYHAANSEARGTGFAPRVLASPA